MNTVTIILAPFHAGTTRLRVGKGPDFLLQAGLLDAIARHGLRANLVEIPSVDDFEGEIGRSFEVKRRVALAVSAAVEAGHFPLVLAGNCNASVGVHSGLKRKDHAIVWLDAHPDFDTPEECLSGYFDGMGVATLAGQCWQRLAATIPGYRPFDLSNFAYCGFRDFSPQQKDKVERHGVRTVYGSHDMQGRYADALKAHINALGETKLLVHLDLDCLDTSVGQANEYAAPGGLTASDLVDCMRCIASGKEPVAMTIASFDPDLAGSAQIAASAVAAVEVICEQLGEQT